jgi:hypothetical protein
VLDRGGWSTPQPGRFTPGKTWYPLCKRLSGPQGRFGWVQKISPPLEFDPQAVQPIASHHADCIILAHEITIDNYKIYYPCLCICIIQADSLWAGPGYRLSALFQHCDEWKFSCCHNLTEVFCVLKYGRCSKYSPLAQIFSPQSLNYYDPFAKV